MNLRDQNIQQLRTGCFDVLIIGGGINGAVCASILSAQGASVALIEKGDFASSTSQETSNLIWGGIKYLQSFELGLVRKLCKSRNHLMRAFPTNIKEIRFLSTIEKGFCFHPILIYISTLLYWAIGAFFTRAPRYLNPIKAKKEEPALNVEISNGACEYSDAWLVDNDARFVFKFIRSALDHGAIAANYIEALDSHREQNIWSTRVSSSLAKGKGKKESFTIRSKVLLNAGGPYVDEYNKNCKQKTQHKHIFSKGIHIIIPNFAKEQRILTFFADDKRPIFVIPMGTRLCIGTTDTRIEKLSTKVDPQDRHFLLENINKRLSLNPPLGLGDIIAERCGVRPLVIRKAKPAKHAQQEWIKLSRKHVIEMDKKNCHISIYGGKLTDCLNIGREASLLLKKLKIDLPYPKASWYGEGSKELKAEFFHRARLMKLDAKTQAGAIEPISQRLWRRYGSNAMDMLEDIRRDFRMAEVLLAGTEYLRVELGYVARSEMVVKLEDFFRRRSEIALVNSKDNIRKAKGLQELCQILFAKEARQKMEEYFNE